MSCEFLSSLSDAIVVGVFMGIVLIGSVGTLIAWGGQRKPRWEKDPNYVDFSRMRKPR